MTTLAAVRAGRAEFSWYQITLGPLKLWVFADAMRIDGVRVAVSATEAQQVADLVGGCLTTPLVEDAIYTQATVRIAPRPGDPVTRTAKQHSAEIDEQLDGRVGLVCTVGKSWVLSNAITPSKACNYGWHGATARYQPVTIATTKVWQQPGTAHNAHHRDYSQTLRLMRRRCELNGVEADVRDLLRDPKTAALLSHEGVVPTRQPGVPEAVERADTEPTLISPALSLGERALLWSRHEMSRENPPTPRRKAELLVLCERAGKRIWTRLDDATAKALNHCAAYASAAAAIVALPGEDIPHGYRAGAKELMDDAIKRGAWVPAARVREGWRPAVGDLAIYDRSQPGKPETSWWGHVDRVSEVGETSYRNLGANEGANGSWVEAWTAYDHPRLLGFIVYPRASVASIPPPVGPDSVPPLPLGDATEPTLYGWKGMLAVDWEEYAKARREAVRDSE